MSLEIKIRRVRKGDIASLHELLKKTFSSLKDKYYPATVLDEESRQFRTVEDLAHRMLRSRAIAYGAFVRTQAIGFLWGTTSRAGDFLGEWGAVAPAFRGRGIFSKLLRSVEAELRRRQLYKFWFYVSATNLPAIECYLKNGYVLEGVHPNHFYGWDFLTFGKVITRRRCPPGIKREGSV